MPVRKTKKAVRKIELKIRDSSDDEDGTVDAENLEDKVTKANLKRYYNYYRTSKNSFDESLVKYNFSENQPFLEKKLI